MDERPVREEGGLHRCLLSEILHEAQNTRGCGSLDNGGQSRQGTDDDPSTVACENLQFLRSRKASNVSLTGDARGEEITHGHHDVEDL